MDEQINQEKAQKWDKVVEYLQISGVFVDCDEEIVMDVLRTGSLNSDKVRICKEYVNSYKLENLDKKELLVIIGAVKERLEATVLSKELRNDSKC